MQHRKQSLYLGLGANLGDPLATLQAACESLKHLPHTAWIGASSFYRSAALEASGPDYCNAVVALESALAPLDLLHAVQALENAHGRMRPYPNAPRTLDIDILLYGTHRINLPHLQIPHPRLTQRAFVLLPLSEIAPATLPILGELAPYLVKLEEQVIEKILL